MGKTKVQTCRQLLAALPAGVQVVEVNTFSPGSDPDVELDPLGAADLASIMPNDGLVFTMVDDGEPVSIHFQRDRVWFSYADPTADGEVSATDNVEAEVFKVEQEFLVRQQRDERLREVMLQHCGPETRKSFELYCEGEDAFENRVFEDVMAQIDPKNLQASAYGVVRKSSWLRALRERNAAVYLLPDKWNTVDEIEENVRLRVDAEIDRNREQSLNNILAELGPWLAKHGDIEPKRNFVKMFMEELGYKGNQNDLDDIRARFEVFQRTTARI